ncbi:MAG: YhdP family protein [Gallionella sp.]|nr:TIGR02099 family protein [Gallionella sp.]
MTLRLFKHRCSWLMRATLMACAFIAITVSVLVIATRYWLLPDIERFHDKITATIASAIGNPVTIGKIEGEWRGLQPSIKLTDFRILDAQQQAALVLPSIGTRVSWKTLLTGELRLASIEIDGAELLVQRNVSGKIFVAGIPISTQGSDSQLSNWLLRQPHLSASNALVVWVDDQREASALVLQQVNVRIENSLSQHRVSLRALPPEELATPLDLRGEFIGNDVAKLSEWQGQVFTQIDYTDVSAWKAWLNLPREFSRGRGALRGWLGVQGGKLASITADLDLHDVTTTLGDDVPEMVLLDLRGRAAWKAVQGGLEISTKNLAMRMQDGVELSPTDFYFRTTQSVQSESAAKLANNELRANVLQFETLVSLANFLPLDASLRGQLEQYGPRGKVTDLDAQWQGTVDQPLAYQIKGKFTDLALRQVSELPGFIGLTLEIDGSDEEGVATIDTQNLIVNAPKIMREPLFFDKAMGRINWQREGDEMAVHLIDGALENRDLAGHVQADYLTQAGTLGLLDLDAKLTRADLRSAARYTPLDGLNQQGGDWLNSSLLAGHSEDFHVRIKANLSDFPLRENNQAIFQIGGHVQDAVMEFDKTWPRIDNISGKFLIDGNTLQMKASTARTLNANLQNVTVTIPDLLSEHLLLKVNGEAVAANSEFLQYIQQSPVRGYVDGFTDHITASGEGKLNLQLGIPLTGTQPVKVDGLFSVQDADVALGAGIPLFSHSLGALSFTQSGMQVKNLTTKIYGGAATVNVSVDANATHATAQGRIDADEVRKTYFNALPNVLHGSTTWNADINVVNKSPQIVITSDLQGISASLPQPFNKAADETIPLRVELASLTSKLPVSAQKKSKKITPPQTTVGEAEPDVITAQLGDLLTAKFLRRPESGVMLVKHGMVNFGDASKPLSNEAVSAKAGVWLTGSLPTLSLQGWEQLHAETENSNSAMPIAGANLRIGKLTGYGINFHDLQVDALKRGDGLSAQLSGNEVNGEIVWQPHAVATDTEPSHSINGKLTAHLKSLLWQSAAKPATAEAAKPLDIPPPGSLPALEVDIDNLQFAGKQIGRIDLVGHPEGKDWRLRRLHVNNPDGELTGEGVWHEDELSKMNSQVNLTLQINDAGKVLARSGYPDTVKDGSGKLTANLSWQGAPSQFNLATLNGALNLDTDKGRFIQMDPGIGKLLSVLSLQALPKHLTLDFNDVFRQGFQFDSIKGNVAIKNGMMDTQDFSIDGSSAKVTMKGNVNLNDTTQNIRVKVLPTVGSTVSLIGAIAISPVVGLGALVANKVLGNPLDKLASFEYNISGTWNDPNVVKLGSEKVKKTK